MNNDELFRRLAAHAGSAEVDPGFDDRLYGLMQGEMGRSRRSTRTVLLFAAAMLLALAAGSAILVGSGILEPPVLPESSVPRLAYELDDDIYLADWDGGNAVRVAGGADAVAGYPQCRGFGGEGSIWAPDGRHLAFRSAWNDECPGEVHVLDAAGRLVATVPGSGWDVSWSPDSTRFATWVEFFQTIGIYSIAGERQALLTVPAWCPDVSDQDPLWSPDGRSVLVKPCEVPIDGGPPRRLLGTDPRWAMSTSCARVMSSPDGARTASVAHEEDGETVESSLVIVEADGTVLHVVREESETRLGCGLVWSPTGDRVAFIQVSEETTIEGNPADSEIRLVDIGTGQVTTLAAAPEIWIRGFSADGGRILYATRDSSVGELWSMDADGSHQQLLVPGAIWGEWQPPSAGN